MKKIKLIALALVGAGMFTACKKYEEGPTVSFRSRKERIANSWKINRAFRNNEDVTSKYDEYELQLSKSGDAKLIARYSFFGVDFSGTTNGTWDFQDKDEKIRFDYDKDEFDKTYSILKLKEDELWLRESGGEDELHLMPR